ncbi:MAG: hypothetical protein KGJ89_05290, partial [Patescibacteria group bacterium]|nr:hypothetical protein [Patescibacteria group bacterium]
MVKKTVDEQLDEQLKKELIQESKEKNKISYKASFPNLVDLVENENHELEYLIFDPTSKSVSVSPSVIIDDRTYQPPPKNLLPHNLLFPRKEEVL